MTELHNLIRTINPYSMVYKMMHKIEKREYKKVEECGLLPKEVKMYKYMVRNNTVDNKNSGAVASLVTRLSQFGCNFAAIFMKIQKVQ